MKLFRQDVLKLALPVFTEQVFVMLMGVINTVMVSNFGKEAVSAVGMVDSINNIFIAFFSSLAVGSTVVVAHYAGRRQNTEVNEAAKQGFYSGIFISLIITVLIFIFRSQIIALLFGAAEKAVIDNTHIYLNITLLTYPLIAATSISSGVLRGAGDTKTPMKVTITMNIINIVLSFILIYGIHVETGILHLTVPGMGVRGAAIGIATARTAGAVLIIFSLIRSSKAVRLMNIFRFRFNLEMQKSIFGVGIPASIESLLFNSGKLITQIFIVGMGTASIAANSIAGSVFGIVNIPGGALSIAAITLVGQHMGRGESKEAESTLRYLIFFAMVCQLPLCLITIPFAGFLTSIYTQSAEVINIAAPLVQATSVTLSILWPVSFILPAGLRGAGDARFTMVISVSSMWIFRITLGYLFGVPLGLGVLGVWLGMFSDWIVRGIIFYLRLAGGKWKNNAVIKEAPAAGA